MPFSRRRQKENLDIDVLNGSGAAEHCRLRSLPDKIVRSKVTMLGAAPLMTYIPFAHEWLSTKAGRVSRTATPGHSVASYEARPKPSGALSWSGL